MAEKSQQQDSRERVALDLMKYITDHASDMPHDLTKAQLFELYHQCYRATGGSEPREFLD